MIRVSVSITRKASGSIYLPLCLSVLFHSWKRYKHGNQFGMTAHGVVSKNDILIFIHIAFKSEFPKSTLLTLSAKSNTKLSHFNGNSAAIVFHFSRTISPLNYDFISSPSFLVFLTSFLFISFSSHVFIQRCIHTPLKKKRARQSLSLSRSLEFFVICFFAVCFSVTIDAAIICFHKVTRAGFSYHSIRVFFPPIPSPSRNSFPPLFIFFL